jgi:hypothetical protein
MERRVCVKVGNLRNVYKNKDISLREWLSDENNIYVGRSGRIFINKEIFHYKGSKWANPYTLKEYKIDECLKLYKAYIESKIKNDPDLYNLNELANKKLGCWCDKTECHIDILIEIIESRV